MTTDIRTNEPTEAQVEAAARALEDHRHVIVAPGPHECSCGEVLDGWATAHKLHRARAALAAAGVTPHPVDEGELVKLADETINRYFDQQDDETRESLRHMFARAVVAHLNKTGEAT